MSSTAPQSTALEKPDFDPIAEGAAVVCAHIADGTPATDIKLTAGLIVARFCGDIVDGELVMDPRRVRRFTRLVNSTETGR